MSYRPFRAVIFDCDGVLVDSEVLSIRGERAALDALGLPYAPEEYARRFIGLHDDAYFEALRADFSRRRGAPPPDDLAERVLTARRAEMAGLTAIPGAEAALRAAAAAAQIAVASSSRAHHLKGKLERTGLYALAAPHVYSADLVARGKPAPDIFLFAAEKLGVAPRDAIVLEDSENGVKAGVAAGMTVWGFLGGGHMRAEDGPRLAAAGAARLVGDFDEFIALLTAPPRDRQHHDP